MLYIPNKGQTLQTSNETGGAAATTWGTSVTTGGSTSTKGSAAELIASTPWDSYWITVFASNYANAATGSDGCMDIMIGAATEEVLIPDLLMGSCGGTPSLTDGQGPKRWDFPLYIPAGSRLSAKAAGRRTSTAFRVAVYLYGGSSNVPFKVGSKVTTYGMGTVPAGTTITPGASGANGTITQITASTSEDHFAFVPSIQVTNDATMTANNLKVQLCAGPLNSEAPFGQPMWFGTGTNESMGGPYNSFPIFKDIPSGTRLSMRASCSGAVDAGYSACIHAVS